MMLTKGQVLVPKDVLGDPLGRVEAAQEAFKLVRIVEVVSGGDVAYRLEGPGRYNYGQTRVARLGELLERHEPPEGPG